MRLLRTENTEQTLIRKCIKGDRKAQRKLFDQYAPLMLAVCRRYVRRLEEAEEVLSNGFIKVFDKLKCFEDKGSFEGWIRKIMVNESLNHLRKGQKIFIEVDPSEFENENIMFSDELDAQHLMILIDQLPIGYRTVFNMYAIEGYKHDEIADMLGISANTSKSQLSKARHLLQQKVLDLNYL